MGGSESKTRRRHPPLRDQETSSSHSNSRYSQYQANHASPGMINKLQKKYLKINDDFSSLSQVTEALANAGLESSNLIVGVDFTKSNEWTGRISYKGRSLHELSDTPNPYEQAISIIGRTLSAFDEDNLIPCYGFGDASTRDQEVFSFYRDNRPCNGFEEALQRYRELAPHLQLSGPTSFAPMIEIATSVVDSTGGQYHVLLLIADGQVTHGTDTRSGKLSPQERDTINAIVKASGYPLSIVMVGVGDGPWDMMRKFDDNIPARAFDNFQFVNFTEIMSKSIPSGKKETEFALAALMEIPSQYKATIDLQLLGKQKGTEQKICLPPPVSDSSISASKHLQLTRFEQDAGVCKSAQTPTQTASSGTSLNNRQVCPVCLKREKNLAFGCGHQTCDSCGRDLQICPVCQNKIATRIRLC